MSEHPPELSKSERQKNEAYDYLSIGAWVAVGILFLNVSYFVGYEFGHEIGTSFDLGASATALSVGLLKASPTILIAVALIDFAFFFHRCGEGDVFTARNVKTLKSGADSLIWAAVVSAIVKPLILDAIGEPGAHEILDFTDLALGVGLMGIALHGFASVLKDAVSLKEDNDQIV